MQTMINFQAKMLGKKRPLIPNWAIPIPEELQHREVIKLRDLITLVVSQEIQAFTERQAERRFSRVLTPDQIESAARQGKVDAAKRPQEAKEAELDCEQAVLNAFTAFQDGLYYVFLDGHQVEDLDGPIYLTANSQVTFLRLVPLAGG
jgi:hypothetical protein